MVDEIEEKIENENQSHFTVTTNSKLNYSPDKFANQSKYSVSPTKKEHGFEKLDDEETLAVSQVVEENTKHLGINLAKKKSLQSNSFKNLKDLNKVLQTHSILIQND